MKPMTTQNPNDLPEEFTRLLNVCETLVSGLKGSVIIGGIAVYLHTANHLVTQQLAGTTHDADIYISLEDLSSLRTTEDVTPNQRLQKHQVIKKGFEFDVYTEFQSGLRLPYDEIVAHSVTYENQKVASLEHLLILKLDAFLDRQGSTKGEKDAHDILRITATMDALHQCNTHLIAPYLGDEHLDLFMKAGTHPLAMGLAKGDAKLAKKLRDSFKQVTSKIIDAYQVIHGPLQKSFKPK